MISSFRLTAFILAIFVAVSSCGGDDNGPTGPDPQPPATQPPATQPPATQPPASGSACTVGKVLEPGESCTYSGGTFEVRSDGFGCVGSGSICAGQGLNLGSFSASKISGTTNWKINALP